MGLTPAERQKRFRERRKLEQSAAPFTPGEEETGREAPQKLAESPPGPLPKRTGHRYARHNPKTHISPEEYVARARENARLHGEELERRWPGQDIEARVDRAEKYARWELAGKP